MGKQRYSCPLITEQDHVAARAYVRNQLLYRPSLHQVSRKEFVAHWYDAAMQDIAGEVWDEVNPQPKDENFEYRTRNLVISVFEHLTHRGDLLTFQITYPQPEPQGMAQLILDTCREIGDTNGTLREPVVGEAFRRICMALGLEYDEKNLR